MHGGATGQPIPTFADTQRQSRDLIKFIYIYRWVIERIPEHKLTGAVLRLVWPSMILLQSARGRVATVAAKERRVRKTG